MKNLPIPASRISIFIIILMGLFFCCCSQKSGYFPEELLDIPLEKIITGEEAKAVVNKLHFNKVTEERNEIAFYKSIQNSITIYITFYRNEESAADNFKKMTGKISPENSVFIGGNFIKLNDITIYRCFGMGQTHFVFYQYENLYWLSVPTIGNEKYLKEYLNRIE